MHLHRDAAPTPRYSTPRPSVSIDYSLITGDPHQRLVQLRHPYLIPDSEPRGHDGLNKTTLRLPSGVSGDMLWWVAQRCILSLGTVLSVDVHLHAIGGPFCHTSRTPKKT